MTLHKAPVPGERQEKHLEMLFYKKYCNGEWEKILLILGYGQNMNKLILSSLFLNIAFFPPAQANLQVEIWGENPFCSYF